MRVERGPDNPDIVLRQKHGNFENDSLNRAGAWDPETVQSILARLLGMPDTTVNARKRTSSSNDGGIVPTTGDVFVVPIGDGTYCLAVVGATSAEHKTVIAFFSARMVHNIPPIRRFAGLTRSSVLRVFACDDSCIRNGAWPVVGPLVGWDPLAWQVPPFVRRDEIARWAFQIDPNPGRPDAEPLDACLPYPVTRVESDGSANSRAIELELTGLLKSDRIVSTYREGIWVAVPLPGEPGYYAPGLITRVAADHKAFLGYFYAEAIEGLPTIERLRDYRPDMAAEIFWFNDVALVFNPWPVVGPAPDWDREQWPVQPQHTWKLDVDSTEPRSAIRPSDAPAPDYNDELFFFEQDGVRTKRMFTKREIVSADYVGYGLRLTIGDRTRRQKLIARNTSRRRTVRH